MSYQSSPYQGSSMPAEMSPLEHIFYSAAAPVRESNLHGTVYTGTSNYASAPAHLPSHLEYLADHGPASTHYHSSSTSPHYHLPAHNHPEYHFSPQQFIAPGAIQPFVGQAQDIQHYIEEAFEHTLGRPLPNDVSIRICNEEEFRKLAPNPGVIGLSFNRKHLGLACEIVVLEGGLGQVMLTIGHEIGHILTLSLGDAVQEEAKAFAFSYAWMEAIKKSNIANLSDMIVMTNGAHNGVHDVAQTLVEKELANGKDALDTFLQIVKGEIK